MDVNAESYLKGPISVASITEVLCYNSKITGLVVDQINLSEISDKVLNLGITSDRNYRPVKFLRNIGGKNSIFIEPKKDLAYAPSSGFDTLIYYAILDEHRSRFPIGYSKLPRVIGNSTLNEVESIHYDQIRVNFESILEIDEFSILPADLGDINLDISDPLKEYLSDYKKRKDLKYDVNVEYPVETVNSNIFKTLPFGEIDNDLIPDTENYYWEEKKKAPIWVGADGIRFETSIGTAGRLTTLRDFNNPRYIRVIDSNFSEDITPTDSDITINKYSDVPDNTTLENIFRYYYLPKFISGEFVVDETGGLWSCPFLSREDYGKGRQVRALFTDSNGNSVNTYPSVISSIDQQPLLDLSKGILVSEESMFSSVTSAQQRVRDVVNTIVPLTLLFTDYNGKIWINLKIGAWFVFNIPQYDINVIQNRTTAVIVPKTGCQYYPINDKSILVRTPRGLNLYNTPGEWCDDYTMNTVVTRFPHSKLLERFSVGGDLVNEEDIFNGPLNRYRKNILPKSKINIVGALNGIIVYYQLVENNKIYINYL